MSKKIKKPEALAKAIPSPQWKEREDYKQENRNWQKKSVGVALRILDVLDKRKMNQSELAEKLNVSRQHVSNILKGQENLTLETISKLESVLGVELIKTATVRILTNDQKIFFESLLNPPAPNSKLKSAMKKHAAFKQKK